MGSRQKKLILDRLHEIHEDSIYYAFKRIEDRAYLEKIKFFERNIEDINDLDEEKSTEIWFYYSQASFEIGEYQKYISLADELLPKIIRENIYQYNDINVYETVLFHKAASHLNLGQYEDSTYIFSELIKIDKRNGLYPRAYLQNKLVQKVRNAKNVKLYTAFMIIVIVVVSISELLIVGPFYPEIQPLISSLREILILALFSFLLVYAAFHYFKARIQIYRLLNN